MSIRSRSLPVVVLTALASGVVASAGTPCDLPTDVRADVGDTRCGVTLVGGVDVSTSGGLGQVAVHDGLAAVVRRDEGIVALVDVSDPAAPVVVGGYDGGTGQAALDHPLDGDVVFSDDGALLFHARQTSDYSNEGLHVLDVTDPSAPALSDFAPQGGMLRVAYARHGDTELVATQDAIGGLTLFQVLRTPAGARVLPTFVDVLPGLHVGGPASAGLEFVEADGALLLYASDGTTGLRVLDVTDPTDVALLGAYDDEGLAAIAVDVRADRTLVHAATEYWFEDTTPPELVTLDVTDPTAITVVSRRNLGGYDGRLAWKLGGLAMADGLLHVAHGHAGALALDPDTGEVLRATTDLGTPTFPNDTYGFLGWFAMDVEPVGDITWVTDAVTGELRAFTRD